MEDIKKELLSLSDSTCNAQINIDKLQAIVSIIVERGEQIRQAQNEKKPLVMGMIAAGLPDLFEIVSDYIGATGNNIKEIDSLVSTMIDRERNNKTA